MASRTKYTLQDLQTFANSHGGVCLSQQYKSSNTKYNWRCQNGHTFVKEWGRINSRPDTFCVECKKTSICSLNIFAEGKGGKCLSTVFTRTTDNYTWECENGHQWQASWHNVSHGKQTWCPECRRHSIEYFEKLAIDKGGKCLGCVSGLGVNGRYLWECEDGHQWETTGGNILYGETWCAQCQKLTLQDCIDEADKRGGKCLTTEYINRRTHIEWECRSGHQFRLTMNSVRNGDRWCRTCFIDKQKLTLEIAQDCAKLQGGECLSSAYTGLYGKMKWRCKEGHEWEVAFNNIRSNGSWCPHCRFKSETACREVFEKWFERPFPKVRPTWLGGLELDGYCEEASAAFEYQGKQHIEFVPHFHRNGESDLVAQMERDERKRRLCKEHGITLIEIEYKVTYKDMVKLKLYIFKKLVESLNEMEREIEMGM
jgi:hypothetical protein